MKTRRVAAVVLAGVVSLHIAPFAAAMPRDDRGDVGSKIVHILKVLQKRLFGLVPYNDAPVPPRP